MTTYALTAETLTRLPLRFIGALGLHEHRHGVSPRRLPDWTRPQIPAPMDPMVRMCSGVRLAFRTNSTGISLQVLTTARSYVNGPATDVVFELHVDGEQVSARIDTSGNLLKMHPGRPQDAILERGVVCDLHFSDLTAEDKDIEIWLPANALVEVRSLTLDDNALLQPVSQSGAPKWFHYGSSISHGANASQPSSTWPAVAARISRLELWNLGFGGHCHLDQFVARTIRDADPDFISIKAGINVVNLDSMRERAFVPALHGFLDTIREARPDTPVTLISPLFAPGCESNPGPHRMNRNGRWVSMPGHEEIQQGCLTLERIRKIMAEVAAERNGAGDTQLTYLDGLELLSASESHYLPDDLHPDTRGYKLIGERFATMVISGLWQIELPVDQKPVSRGNN